MKIRDEILNILVIHNIQDQKRKDNILQQFAGQSTRYDYEIIPAIMNSDCARCGISSSFKSCIRVALERDWESVCIMEDDVRFLSKNAVENFFITWRRYFLPTIEAILLGGIYEGKIKKILSKSKMDFARVEGKVSGLHMGIYPKCLYEKILEAEEGYNLDSWLSTVKQIPMYTSYPFLAVQQDGFFSYNVGEITDYTRVLHLKYHLTGYPAPAE